MHYTTNVRRLFVAILVVTLISDFVGCGATGSVTRPTIPETERPTLAVLGFDIGVKITKLSAVKTVTGDLQPEREAFLIEQAVREIKEEARRLFYNRLESSEQFRLASLPETDAAVQALGIQHYGPLDPVQLKRLRDRLGVDLVVTGTVLDYGKVRWQWLAAGMAGDITWESAVIGAATAWNPIALLANLGFELLTSTPVWFGGGYLFGVAFRPVRAEARAAETVEGEEVWSDMGVAIYARKELKEVPEQERRKKEVQLGINLKRAMEGLADSLLEEGLTKTELRERRRPVSDVVSF